MLRLQTAMELLISPRITVTTSQLLLYRITTTGCILRQKTAAHGAAGNHRDYDIKISTVAAIWPANAVPVKLLHLTVMVLPDTFTPVTTALPADFNCTMAFLTVFEYALAILDALIVPVPSEKLMFWSVTTVTVLCSEPITILFSKAEFF